MTTSDPDLRIINSEQDCNSAGRRRAVAVCGAWEDAENYNLFIESLMRPLDKDKYIVLSFTFGLPTGDNVDTSLGLEFDRFIEKFDLAAMFVFAEMIKNEEVIGKLRETAHQKGIPVVFLERQAEGVINAVLNYSDGFERMVKHVLEHHGLTRVNMFAGFKDNPYSIERENIFKRLMLSHKLSVGEDDILYGDFWDATTLQVLDKKLDEGMELPQAFVCANDSMAVGVCDCLKRRGIRVPEDVVVTGFDGAWHGRYHNPVITTAAPEFGEIVGYVIDIIEGRTEYEPGRTVKVEVGFKEIPGGSCGCCRRSSDDWYDVVNTLANDNQDYFRHMLEMGKFVTKAISMDSIEEASTDLQHYLWLWKKQYYFVGLTRGLEDGCVNSILHGRNGEYVYKEEFKNLTGILPEYDSLIAPGSGINILLFRQIRSVDTDYGYMCCGYESLSMREQQRFEEFGLHISAMVSSVLSKVSLLEANAEISRMSEMDYLTNLYNRRGFFSKVEDILKETHNRGRIFTLFSIDMDGLKYINDHFGHLEGDNAIIILSNALKSYAGEDGVCARYGGDEFAMAMVGDINIADDAAAVRDKIHAYAAEDPLNNDLDYDVNASIGIAECVITGNENIEDLIREADLRMYEDKQSRKRERGIR